MENELERLAMLGQNRAPNTVKLKPKYDDYALDQQALGKDVMPFAQWVQENYPDMKILKN